MLVDMLRLIKTNDCELSQTTNLLWRAGQAILLVGLPLLMLIAMLPVLLFLAVIQAVLFILTLITMLSAALLSLTIFVLMSVIAYAIPYLTISTKRKRNNHG